MKSYCTFSIPLNPIKKTTQGPPTINFLVFSLSSFLIDFFLSLHSVLSLLSIALFVLGWSKYARTFLNHQQKNFPKNPTLQNCFFSFLSSQPQPEPPATTRRPTAWLSGQICNHRGHAVKHGPRWFLVVLQPRFPVLFRCSDLHGSNDDPNGLEAAPRWFLVVGCSDQFGGFRMFKFLVVFCSNLHGSNGSS